MKTYRHIIVGIDFSPACRSALKTAVRIAAASSIPVTAVHVMDAKLAAAIKEAHNFSDEQLFGDMTERVQAFMEDSEIGTQLVKSELTVGHPFAALGAACLRHQADLLVLGSRGSEHGPNQVGTVASKCLRKAPADVLLVRVHGQAPFKQVLACVDLSETSAIAVRSARWIAEQDGSQLDCLFVYQSALALSLDYGGFVPPLPVADVSMGDTWKKDVDDFVQPLLRTSDNLAWRSLVVERVNIREAIVEHIKETGTDLVVLGTRGKTDLRTLLLGTTAEKVVAHAPCSILAVKPDGFVSPLASEAEPVTQVPVAETSAILPPAVGPLA
ncbi:MAG: universal stress protein [Verrucomicrobium sp.]|nr:universal stress protein [Verrucomicrobium sp.]